MFTYAQPNLLTRLIMNCSNSTFVDTVKSVEFQSNRCPIELPTALLVRLHVSLFQISLNEGAHQLRLYHKEPNGVDPFMEGCLRKSANRAIPCATLLVRLAKAPLGSNGVPLEVRSVLLSIV